MLELGLEWTCQANAMAGSSLTLAETQALLRHDLTAPAKPLREHLDAAGHHAAVRWLVDFARTDGRLTEQLVRALHQLVLGRAVGVVAPEPAEQASRPGHYKTRPNNALNAAGEPVYFSSPEDAQARVTELLGWCHHELAQPKLHPVYLAAKVYHLFSRIRPFDDGNGRLAGLLLNFVLLRHGYGITVVQAADHALCLAALEAADAGKPKPFLQFVIENVEASLRRQIRAAKGESVAEPTDLALKLASLKEELHRRDDTVHTLWNGATQAAVCEALLGPWLDEVNLQTQGFDELFMTVGYAGSLATALPQPVLLDEEGSWESFTNGLQAAVASAAGEVSSVGFSKRWYHFRQRDNGFDASVRLSFDFHPDHFSVRAAVMGHTRSAGPEIYWEDELFTSVYLPEYAPARLHEVNYQLATLLYQFVADKMAVAVEVLAA